MKPAGDRFEYGQRGGSLDGYRASASREPLGAGQRRFIHKKGKLVNISTPFPDRPPIPLLTRGMGGLGDYTLSNGQACDPGLMGPVLCQDSTVRIINAIAAGTATAAQIAAGNTLGVSGANCPIGTIYNPSTLSCQPGVGVSATANSGMILLLIAGAVLFFMARR